MKTETIIDAETGETQVVDYRTAAERAADEQAERARLARQECRQRILAVASIETQVNLSAARAAERLSAAQVEAHDALIGWIEEMRAAVGEQDWPEVPAGVADLVADY